MTSVNSILGTLVAVKSGFRLNTDSIRKQVKKHKLNGQNV